MIIFSFLGLPFAYNYVLKVTSLIINNPLFTYFLS